MMTPEELKALAEIEAAKSRGEDPFGDDDDDQSDDEGEQVVANEGDGDNLSKEADYAGADDSGDGDDAADAKSKAEAEAEDAQDGDEPAVDEPMQQAPTAYKTDLPEDYKAQRTELVKQKASLMKKLMDGEMDADSFAAEESTISDKLEDLTAQRIRAETLQEANSQSTAQYQQREIQKVINRSKSEIDYTTDAKAQRQFDMALTNIGQDPDNVGKDYSELLTEAHRVVLALRGITSKGQQVADAIKSRAPEGKPPITLRNLPAASTPNANGDMVEQLGRLKGAAYEAAFSKLSPVQRRSLLDEA